MRQINIYKYDELPTKEAKDKAINWIIEEELNPGWQEEHFNSMNRAIFHWDKSTDKEQLIKDSQECKFTGYCADCLLSDLLIEQGNTTKNEIEQFYKDKWNKELNERLKDIAYMEELLAINEYEFLEDGTEY